MAACLTEYSGGFLMVTHDQLMEKLDARVCVLKRRNYMIRDRKEIGEIVGAIISFRFCWQMLFQNDRKDFDDLFHGCAGKICR